MIKQARPRRIISTLVRTGVIAATPVLTLHFIVGWSMAWSLMCGALIGVPPALAALAYLRGIADRPPVGASAAPATDKR